MWDVVILGAGAAGCFCALRLLEEAPYLRVIILEPQKKALQKLKVSGGGRCNVTHGLDEINTLLKHYPRQHRQLKGQLLNFPPSAMRDWLARHGVPTHCEGDGRVFPATNQSHTIIQLFLDRLHRLGATVQYESRVKAIHPPRGEKTSFQVQLANGESLEGGALILATGSHPSGYALAESLGLPLVTRAPSLFTFCVNDAAVHQRAGLAVQDAQLNLRVPGHKKPWQQRGPLLMTHWGLSGPAVLKLSAQAALALQGSHYRASLRVNALPESTQEASRETLIGLMREHPQRQMKNSNPSAAIPARYWGLLLDKAGIPEERPAGELSQKMLNRLVENLHALEFEVDGKGVFKEEFVTAGGVDLQALHGQRLEARHQPGLFAVGELLNVDGMTGGFNFQHCWASANAVALALTKAQSVR